MSRIVASHLQQKFFCHKPLQALSSISCHFQFRSIGPSSSVASSSISSDDLSQSGRFSFKQTPVNPSILKYIERVGVGKPKRTKRRKKQKDFQFLTKDEEMALGRTRERGNRRSHPDAPPPLPFPSSSSDSATETNGSVQRFPVKLLKSVGDLETSFPKSSPNLPEVAIAGRSNVGKSTLLNALLYGSPKNIGDKDGTNMGHRKHVHKRPTKWTAKLPKGLKAATSARPGETRAVSFYQLSAKIESSKRSLLLVDLPGYGFAFASKEKADEWQLLMKSYLLGRGKALKRILLLIDSRHGMKAADYDFLESMQSSLVENWGEETNSSQKKSRELPSIQIVLTKCDLVSQADLARRVVLVQKQLSNGLRRQPSALPVMLVSAQIEGQGGVLELQKELAALVPEVS